MKQYLLKVSGAALLLSLMAGSVSAQQEEGDKKRTEKSDVIIIRPKEGKNTKITVEIKDGEVKVNGKPLSEFKDDDVTVSKRKSLESMTVTGMPGSRFRSGAWSYSDDMVEEKAFLGVTTDKTTNNTAGARLRTVAEGSAAEKAGLKKDDIITKINDHDISSPGDLTQTIGKYKPEEKVKIVFKRDGKEQSLTATLGKRKMMTSMNFAPGTNFPPGSFNFDGLKGLQDMNVYGYGYNSSRRKLGIKAQETEEGKGVKVIDVDDESPAGNAGIKEGDIITEFDGTEVNNVEKLREVAAAAAAKPSFKVKLLRDGKIEEIQVKIPKNLKTANL